MPNGKIHTYAYKTAQEVEQDDNGPRGVNLISFRGEFPPQVAHGWAEQNMAPTDAYPADRQAPIRKPTDKINEKTKTRSLNPKP